MNFKFPKIKVSPKFTSRKLWLAVISALLPIFNQHLGWGLDEEVIVKAISGLWVWIVVEGTRDAAAVFNGK